MYAGSLHASAVFDHIISIGYEFETHELTKLSLNDGMLVNTPATMASISDGLANNSVTKVDPHRYRFTDTDLGMDIVEYMDEKQPSGDIMFSITNDLGESNFGEHLAPKCKDLPGPKNDLYMLDNKPIKFSGLLNNDTYCYDFSGVEWIITYYKPTRGPDVIMQTFLNACRIIAAHLHGLAKRQVALTAAGTNIGTVFLYQHPKTNMYYMQTHDKNRIITPINIDKAFVVPQMTFRCRVMHAAAIMKQITIQPISNRSANEIQKEHDKIAGIEKCAELLVAKQNLSDPEIEGYLFLILYKLYVYVNDYVGHFNPNDVEDYFKNYLVFMTRENNGALYRRMKKRVEDVVPSASNPAQYIIALVNQPDILGEYIYTKSRKQKALTHKPLTARSKSYGDPSVSFVSYFHYLESTNSDWLIDAGIDVFTGSGGAGFNDDTLLIENRWFFDEMRTYLKLEQNIPMGKYMELGDLQRIYTQLVTNKKLVANIADVKTKIETKTKTKTKTKKRQVKRCAAGSRRNKKTGACDKK